MKNISYFLVTIITVLSLSCSSKVQKASTNINKESTLRIMTYNVHHCNPPTLAKDSVIDVEAVAKAIRLQNPDIVALQEIDVNTNRSRKIDEAKLLADKLAMHYFFAKAIDYDDGGYGVAILSKYPLSETTIHRLPTEAGTNGERRVFATARIKLPTGEYIHFGCTHLDVQKDPATRILQISEISRIAGEENGPFIIAGDFNATPGSSTINILDQYFTRTCQDCDPTIPSVNPIKTIDFIAFAPKSGFTIQSSHAVQEHYASDHLPVVAVFKQN